MLNTQENIEIKHAEFAERLNKARANKNMELTNLSEQTGISYEMVRRYTLGIARPRTEGMEKLAAALDVSAAWLQFGESMMPPAGIVADLADYRSESDTHWPIDMYDVKLSAGTGNCEWIMRKDEPLYFRQAWFKARRLSRADLRGMYVRGDSMEPVLKNWDTVIIDTADTEPTDGEIYAVIYKDKFYIKTVRNVADGIDLISYNPDYPPIEVREAERFQCLGRMVWRGG